MMLLFLIKILLCSGLLYGYYYLFLRNKRFHLYNRFYLLFSAVTSTIIPFLKIPVSYIEAKDILPIYQTLNVMSGEFNEPGKAVASASAFLHPQLSVQTLACLIYATGVFFFIFMLIKSLMFIRNLSKKYLPEHWQDLRIYNTLEEGTPFSFFRSIYWNKKIDVATSHGQQIFRHELYHVRNYHTADILFMELLCIAGWFNPFFYLFKKELKAIHEFLADQYAAAGNDRYDYAELLVLHTIDSKNSPITNNFFNNHIKRRITMLTSFSNTCYNYWSRVMSLPLGIILFCFISLHATSSAPIPKKAAKVPLIVVLDAGHGGMDPGVKSGQGIDEKKLCLDMAKKVESLSSEYNVKVVMTREDDQLPGHTTDISESLKNRVLITRQAKADLFISIHINYAPQPSLKEGFDIYVPSVASKNPYLEKSKIAGSIFLSLLKEKYHVASKLNLLENQGVYVLNQAPCPAVMVSCGYTVCLMIMI
ncbi:MAG: M56/M15 family metallopeptidase [Chitinophagaceae bacterium]